jgi:tRNA (guanine10-N2)-dimethyltransferase
VKLLLELSLECESLAKSEALAACEALCGQAELIEQGPGIVVLETGADPRELACRLGLCHVVSEYLFSCAADELESRAAELEVEGPIRIRSTKVGARQVDLSKVSRGVGAIVGRSRGVDLHQPKTDLRIVFSSRVHVGKAVASIDRSGFEKRKNRYMPYFYPASLHPKFARALINMSRVRAGGRLLDPFCGTGAIVAEGALVGVQSIGTDLSEKMIEGARANLDHLRLKADLRRCDVGDIVDTVGHVDGIATDPPYGKSTSTRGEKIPALYERAFQSFSSVLDEGACVAVVVPKLSLLEGAEEFRLVEEHKLWVHRSLTRHFCLLCRR